MNLYRVAFFIYFMLLNGFAFPCFGSGKPVVTDSRVKRWVHSEDEVIDLQLHYKYQSYVEMAKNEVIRSIAVGDSSSWRIVPDGNKVYIRPLEKNAETNMIIVTNRSTYTFDLIAVESIKKADVTYIMRFYYPELGDEFEKDKSVELLEEKVINNASELFNSQQIINHDYSFTGDNDLLPLEMFDNGKLSFFKFKEELTPKVFIVKEDEAEYATEMISFEGMTIINGVYDKLTLRYQDKKLTITKGRH